MKKIILDCYTYRPEVYEYSKIDKSTNFIPDWWKNLPPSGCPVTGEMEPTLTMKSCPGFTSFFKNTYTLPLWSDLKLRTTEETWAYQYADNISEMGIHDEEQYKGFMEGYQQFKLSSPWFAVCNKPIQWAFIAPSWHPIKGVHILSGLVDYYYQHTTNINMFVDKPIEVILPFDTPLVHLIPMTEQKVEIRHHLVSEKEWFRFKKPSLTFAKTYYKIRRLMNGGK